MKVWTKIKCFLGFHVPASTGFGNIWHNKRYLICELCKKTYRDKRKIRGNITYS